MTRDGARVVAKTEAREGVARATEESLLEGLLEDARGNGGNFGETDDRGARARAGAPIDGFDRELVVQQ